jgi:hypothetical protein
MDFGTPTKTTTMSDDIVDRLMTLFWTMKDAGRVQDKNTIADAIAEIERLQAEVQAHQLMVCSQAPF